MSANAPECLWPLGARLGEGPVWLADEAALMFVDILAPAVHRCAADGTRRQSWPMPRPAGFVLPLAGEPGQFVVGLQGGLHRFAPADGRLAPALAVEPDRPANRINDGHVDARGRLWFGTMHVDAAQRTGILYRLDDGGVLSVHDGPYACTNGPAFSPDGRTAYHADTMNRTVHAFDVADDGSLGAKRAFARVAHGHPDGMAVDADGHLWLALFGGGRVERYTPQGRLVQTVAFPCSHVTKLAFGGRDLRTAYVTTARCGLTPAQLARQPLAGALFGLRVDTPGLPQHGVRQGWPP